MAFPPSRLSEHARDRTYEPRRDSPGRRRLARARLRQRDERLVRVLWTYERVLVEQPEQEPFDAERDRPTRGRLGERDRPRVHGVLELLADRLPAERQPSRD